MAEATNNNHVILAGVQRIETQGAAENGGDALIDGRKQEVGPVEAADAQNRQDAAGGPAQRGEGTDQIRGADT